MDGKRILPPLVTGVALALFLFAPSAPAASVRQIQGRQVQDGGQVGGDARSRGGTQGKGRRTPRTGQRKFFKQAWIAERHRRIAVASRQHERTLIRARKNLERHLSRLVQARVFLLNRQRVANPAGRPVVPDNVLKQISRIRTRVLQAYRGSVNALRRTAASTRLAFRRLEREVDPGDLRSRIEAEAVRAENRMRKSAQAFHRRAAAHRKSLASLARKTRTRLQELLKKGVRPRSSRADRDAARKSGPRAAAGQNLDRLKKMKPEQRRRLYQNRLRDYRRLKELEKKLKAMEKGIERLKKRARANARKKPVV